MKTQKKKASEIIRRYKKGERKFCVNLRGESFQNQDLSDADFSEADIRGANFKGATLQRVKFRRVNAGLQKRQLAALLIVSFLLLALSGVIVGFASGWIGVFLSGNENPRMPIAAGVTLLLLSAFLTATIRQGLGAAFKSIVVAIALAIVVAIVVAVATDISLALDVIVGFSFTGAFVISGSIAVAISIPIATAIAGVRVFTVTGVSTFTFIVAVITAVNLAISIIKSGSVAVAVAVAIAVVFVTTFLCTYVGWLALSGDKEYALIRTVAIAFAAIGGTTFQGADLTHADFTEATLKSTDLRDAVLSRTRWYQAKKLDRVRLGGTYLKNAQWRQLLITGEGQNQNFDRLGLRALNLRGANLNHSSFIDTDLYQANLQDANLSAAILVRTQLERADLTGATLTGACIQDWSITRSTKLYNIDCKYVYLKYIDGDKCERMPPKGEFQNGEFIFFVRSILDTLDLYHDRDVNPRAAVIVLRSLADDYQEPLEIVGLEKRGNGIIIKLKTSEFANQEQLKQEYYSRYSQTLTLFMKDPEKILPSYEVIETKVTELVENIKQRPTTSIKYLYNKGLFITGGEQNMNIKQSGSFGIGVNQGEIKAEKLAGTLNEAQPKNIAEVAAEIQQLLEQLSQTYPTTSTAEKMVVVTEAADRIEKNPTLKARVINALTSGGTEAFKEAIDHPLVNILLATIEGWQEGE